VNGSTRLLITQPDSKAKVNKRLQQTRSNAVSGLRQLHSLKATSLRSGGGLPVSMGAKRVGTHRVPLEMVRFRAAEARQPELEALLSPLVR
jgi:hypothetical protein